MSAATGKAPFLPYGRQCIEDDDIAAVAAVLRGDYLTTGPAVTAFEASLAKRLDAPHAVACSSATAGLHLAMMAAGLGPGDAAVVPAVTFLATANAVRYVGADVIFADVDADSGVMLPEHLEAALAKAGGRRVKAVLPVALAGQTADPVALQAIAGRAGAIVVEDACHALGASYGEGIALGACRHSDMAVFSFHPVKTIAMGEGGAVTTRAPELAEKLARFRSHGMVREPARFGDRNLGFDADGSPNPWYYEMPEPGYNYRASDVHCALGTSQLGKLDRFVARRAAIARLYDAKLAKLAPRVMPLRRLPGCVPAWHLYVALIDFKGLGMTRGAMMRALHAHGVGTQVHYLPVPRQPYYRHLYGDLALPGADAYYERCLSLPLFPQMQDEDVDRVVDALERVIARG